MEIRDNDEDLFHPNDKYDPMLLGKAKKKAKELNYGSSFRLFFAIVLIICLYFDFTTQDFRDKWVMLLFLPIACYLGACFINWIWIYFLIKTVGRVQKTAAYYGTIAGAFSFFCFNLFVDLFYIKGERKLPTKNAFRVGKTLRQLEYFVWTFGLIKIITIAFILFMYFQSHGNIRLVKTTYIFVWCLVGGWFFDTLGLVIGLILNFKIMNNNGKEIAYIFLWIGAFVSGILAIVLA